MLLICSTEWFDTVSVKDLENREVMEIQNSKEKTPITCF